jgi:CHRD domain-containing protein
MVIARQLVNRSLRATLVAATLLFGGYTGAAAADEIKVVLSGNQEIPPVTTSAAGTGTIGVGPDKSVRGSVIITGLTATATHIHEAEAGKNGPIVIPLTQTADNIWTVPEGAKLTDTQYESYKAGKLYYNVHSAAYKGGEIRGQIKP